MGEYFESIADVEATEDQAAGLAQRLTSWLIESGVIAAERTDCVIGDLGYPPGPGWASVVIEADEAHTPYLRNNGLEVSVGRTVFHSGGDGVSDVECPRCGAHVALQEDSGPTPSWDAFSATLGTWYEGGESSVVACPRCSRPVDFNDWIWTEDWGRFAVAFLGLTFWNWPPLTDSFVAEVAARLGHRVVRTRGKL